MSKHLLLLTVYTLLSACVSPETPKKVFGNYMEQEKKGFTSFEVFLNFYSERKTTEIKESISQILKQHPEKKEDKVKISSLEHFKRFAKCKEYTFENEEIKNDKATLTYSVNNICDKPPFVNTEYIFMVNESGWKIDEVDIKL